MNREDAKYSLRNTIISQEDLKASQGGKKIFDTLEPVIQGDPPKKEKDSRARALL